MAEYLEYEKVLDDKNIITVQTKEYGSIEVIPVDTITDIELADVQPVKRGKWEYYKNNGIFDTHKCTLCGEKYEMYMDIEPTTIYKYCPNCGADMREED